MMEAKLQIAVQNGKVVTFEIEMGPEFTSSGITEVGFIAQPDLFSSGNFDSKIIKYLCNYVAFEHSIRTFLTFKLVGRLEP